MHRVIFRWLLLIVLSISGCVKKIPRVDLSGLDPEFVERCTNKVGGIITLDERHLAYSHRGYENSSYKLFAGDKTVVQRRVIKLLSEAGVARASRVSVYHYREYPPEIVVSVWKQDGTQRMVNVHVESTTQLANWPCELHVARRTDFQIATLMVGDIVEIIQPITGPDTLYWTFGSQEFCLLHSRAIFGHASDENRPDLHAIVVDASGAVTRTSQGDSYPMIFELKRPIMPISKSRLPYVLLAPRCPGWEHLRGQLFHLPLWMARHGSVTGRTAVNPMLTRVVENNERLRRIRTTANWMRNRIHLEESSNVPAWMRWMPTETAENTATKRKGNPGSWAVLAFRILEDAGLKPRFALIHTHPLNPFDIELESTTQFDTLAVVVEDEHGSRHWLVPGYALSQSAAPKELLGRHALIIKRYWIDRQQGSGTCIPVEAVGFSCQLMTPEPIELELITVAD